MVEPEPQDENAVPLATRIERFLERHRGQLLAHAQRQLRGGRLTIEPEDVVQAASLSFYLYFTERQQVDAGPGLMVLARRFVETAISDQLKWQAAQKRGAEQKAQQMPSSHHVPASPITGPLTRVARDERRLLRHQALQQAMQELTPLDRQVFELRLVDDEQFTFGRIAGIVGIAEDAVRMRYRRAIARLKPVLSELLADDSGLQ